MGRDRPRRDEDTEMTRWLAPALMAAVIVVALGACIPGTYFDPLDNYARGLRLFDRGQPENAILFWKPLAEIGDCDAQYLYGTLFFLGVGVQQSFDLSWDWWSSSVIVGVYRYNVMHTT